MLSSIAHVEPLPLVPATTIVGTLSARPSLALTVSMRASVSSIVFGWTRSQWSSHSARVFFVNAGSGDGVGRQAQQHRDLPRDRRAQLAAIDDHVDRARLEQELGALEAFGQLLADGVLDHARPSKADQRLRLG